MVLLLGFFEVLAFCSRIVALQAFWFLAALGAWERHICPSFLVFRGTPLELSQSHFNCVAHPEDSNLWRSLGIPAQSVPLGSFSLFYPSILAGWAFFFLPFVLWVLRPISSWILGFKSFELAILFPCDGLNLFNIIFHGIGPSCCFLWALMLWFFRP